MSPKRIADPALTRAKSKETLDARYNIRLPAELRAELERICEKEGVKSLNVLVVSVLQEFVERLGDRTRAK